MLDPLGSTLALADGPSAVGRMPSQSFAAVPPSVPPSGVPASGVPASAVGPASVVVPASAVVPASPVVPASEELPASAGVPVDPPTTGACDEPHPAPTSIAAAPITIHGCTRRMPHLRMDVRHAFAGWLGTGGGSVDWSLHPAMTRR